MPTPTPAPPPPLAGNPHTPPKIDLPTKRRRKQSRTQRPRRDNRKSRYDADYIGDDERTNAAFEAYYRGQGIVPEEEYEKLFSILAIPLPTSFRVTADGAFRDDIQNCIAGEMSDLFRKAGKEVVQSSTDDKDEKKGKEEIKPPRQLQWYPEGLAWTVSAPRQMLRRDNVLAPFHKYLVRMNDLGAVNRQEAVSMIPPLLLDTEPGQAVLDMCASPGSKTAQILENVSPRGRALSSPGVVIANDADIKRCWMLAHQLKRFASADLVVTHHEAQYFPKFMTFDRILCDVPCTGDGTMRKAPDIWRRWTPDMGIGIHRLQRMILQRGVELLKPDGRLVYSTCSMNPLENEAVVADALRRFQGDVELVDCSDRLPGLIRRKGLTTWMVKNNSDKVAQEDGETLSQESGAGTDKQEDGGEATASKNDREETGGCLRGWFQTFDEVPLRRQKKIVKSLFPPSTEELASGNFPLHRCMRLVPHDQDTGGFFVSVLRKKANARITRRERRDAEAATSEGRDGKEEEKVLKHDTKEEGMDVQRETAEVKEGKLPRKTGRGGTRLITDDPLVSVYSVSASAHSQITNFFGLDRELMLHCLLTRGSDDKFKRVFVVSRSVRTVLRHALGTRDTEVPIEKRVLRVVNAGVRVLERTDRRGSTCPFRLVQEGAHLMRFALGNRCVEISFDMIAELLKKGQVAAEGRWQQVVDIGSGSAIVQTEGMEVVAWVGRHVIQAVAPADVLSALRMRINGQSA